MKNLSAGLLLLICCILAAACSHRNFAARRNTMLYAQQLPDIHQEQSATRPTVPNTQPECADKKQAKAENKTSESLKVSTLKKRTRWNQIPAPYRAFNFSVENDSFPYYDSLPSKRPLTTGTKVFLWLDTLFFVISGSVDFSFIFFFETSPVLVGVLIILLMFLFVEWMLIVIKMQKKSLGDQWRSSNYGFVNFSMIFSFCLLLGGLLLDAGFGLYVGEAFLGLGIVIFAITIIVLAIQLFVNISRNS